MKTRFLLLSFSVILFLIPQGNFAQGRIFKNYRVKDGLASSTVYHSFQDSRGFIWFGTDQGACRFDGTNFKTFTTSDGLPDNDVFKIEEDSLGRLWMICYNSRPCFMYNGVIHNSDNDSLLRNIDAHNLFNDVETDRQGRIWLLGEKIYAVDKNRILKSRSPDGLAAARIGYMGVKLSMVTGNAVYHVELNGDSIVYKLISQLELVGNTVSNFSDNECYVLMGTLNKEMRMAKVTTDTAVKLNLYSLGITNAIGSHSICRRKDSVLLISAGVKGIKAFNLNLNPLPDPYPFLPGNVSYTFTMFDKEGNTWITSLGRGVFFIPANKTIRYKLSDEFRNPNATSVLRWEKTNFISVGFDNASYALLRDGELTQHVLKNTGMGGTRIIRQCSLNENTLILGADFGMYAIYDRDPSYCELIQSFCVKNVISEGKDSVLVGAMDQAVRVIKSKSGFQFDSLWNVRTTAIAKDNRGRIWLGTLTGLFVRENERVTRFAQNPLINKSRITDLLYDGYGNIWVATHQRGLFTITGDSIIAINTHNGLPSDVCMRLFKESERIIWVCTNRHISKITVTNNSGRFSFDISTLGELSDDEEVAVNDLFVDSFYIWVATSTGLLQIEKASLQSSIPPPVYVTSFHASDSVFTDWSSAALKYFQNNIQIDYVGISYNSGGKMVYKYLLGNSSSDTVFTRNTSLNLSSMLPGKYSLRVWARNIAGVWSDRPAVLTFEIFPPFWKTEWFLFLLLLAVTLAIWTVVRWRITQIRNREKEKTSVYKKIAEVELQAVRAQMNEHFIFNSLNSIQNYINQNNTEAANFYLANFGKLIRRTLDISSMPVISLQAEIDYLNNYLTLEKMRFGETFNYSLTNDITSVPSDVIIFPSMILQPYVENAIRHGLRHKPEGRGILKISFEQQNGFVVCSIDDNGIGRKKAEELKSKRNVEHQSKGIKLSEDRVFLFNRAHENKTRVETEDKKDAAGNAAGTLVKVFVPFNTSL